MYGIIGYPLSHSFSPAYFKRKFEALGIDATYTAFPLASVGEFIPLLAANPGIAGLSVTIPYKEAIMPCLDEIDDVARTIGAVNCITIKNGIKKGYNTDVIGFEKSLLPLLQPHHTAALVLGTGGASKAVIYVLAKLGIPFQKVSRNAAPGTPTYSGITPEIITTHPLIINTTPLGMYPDTGAAPPIPYHATGNGHLLYDLIYNPAETAFLLKGKENGAMIKNGLEMLELQADASWEIMVND